MPSAPIRVCSTVGLLMAGSLQISMTDWVRALLDEFRAD
jgi:hypothetical protein